MKKIVFLFVSMILTTSMFAIDAEVIEVKGKAESKTVGNWKTIVKGQKLSQGVMISTGFKSTVTLKIDGSVLVVQQLTRLKLEEIIKKEETVSSNVFLDVGSIKANIKPKSTKKVNFNVKTPVATASVRGTSGQITAGGKLVGNTGVWKYAGKSGAVYVRSGDTVIFNSDGSTVRGKDILMAEAKSGEPKTLSDEIRDVVYTGAEVSSDAENSKIIGLLDVSIDW